MILLMNLNLYIYIYIFFFNYILILNFRRFFNKKVIFIYSLVIAHNANASGHQFFILRSLEQFEMIYNVL